MRIRPDEGAELLDQPRRQTMSFGNIDRLIRSVRTPRTIEHPARTIVEVVEKDRRLSTLDGRKTSAR